jgi:hypothetical protein
MRLFKRNKEIVRSWKDVSLAQLQEIESLPKYDNELDMMLNYVSILLDKDSAEIENMIISDILEEFERWRFLSTKPKEKHQPIITLNGVKYGAVVLNELTLGQISDIEAYINEGLIENLHKVFSVLYLPIKSYNPITKKVVLEEYEPDKDRQNAFLHASMDILYPQMLFFYHIVKDYLQGILLYSEEEMMTMTDTEMMEKMMKMIYQLEELLKVEKQMKQIK